MEIHIRKAKRFIRQKYHSVIINKGKVTYTQENVTNLSDCISAAETMANKAGIKIYFEFEPPKEFNQYAMICKTKR